MSNDRDPATYSASANTSQQPRKRRRSGALIVGVLAVLLICTMGSCTAFLLAAGETTREIDRQIQYGSTTKKSDVNITACRTSDMGVEIDYTVRNSSDRTETYIIAFAITNVSGVRIGETYGSVNSLSPGASSQDTAHYVTVEKVPNGITCSVTRVD